jgi:amino acid adenylation domain-containing protein
MADGSVHGFRLSPQQRHLWSLVEADGGGHFVCRAAVSIRGDLDEATWRVALDAVVERHEILRTAFRCLPGVRVPVQVVLNNPQAAGEISTGAAGAGDAAIDGFLGAEARSRLDLASGAVVRTALLPVDPSHRLFLLELPALCADGQSLHRIVADLAAAYDLVRQGARPEAAPMQYADLAEWQNQLLDGEEAGEGLAFWARRTTAGRPPRLHFERSSAGGPFRPLCLRRPVDPSLVAAIDAARGRLGVELSTWLLGCWQVLLWRLADQEEVTVGWCADGRSYEDLADAVGPLCRVLPVGAELSSERPLSAVLERIREARDEASAWQEYFSWEARALPNDSRCAPFFTFGFRHVTATGPICAGDIELSIIGQRCCTDRHLLALSSFKTPEVLELCLDYDAAHCSAAGVERLATQLNALLTDAAAHPDAPIGRLGILGHDERQRVLVDFNRTASEVDPSLCLHHLIEAQVARTPEATALVAEHGSLSYRELNEGAYRLAAFLRSRGVGPESLVGVYLDRGLEMVVALLGILKAGAAYVPLDPDYPAARVAFMIEDSAVPLVLTTERRAADLAALRAPADAGHQVVCLDRDWPSISRASGEALAVPLTRDDPAYVIYTSGSTGQPKGAVICHRQIVNHMLWMQREYPLTPEDVVLQKTPFCFDASVWEFFAPLLAGARLVMARPGGHQNPAYIVDALLEHGITILQIVPSFLRLLLDDPRFAASPRLRRVFCGGEALTLPLVERFLDTVPAELVNLYGPTETTVEVASFRCGTDVADGPAQVPIGRPISNVQLYVLDRALEPQPIGVRGELYVTGEAVARGYLKRPELTARRFVPDPFNRAPEARMYRTGDMAAWREDGTLDYFGRRDHEVKVRGFRVDLGEIEALLAAHPGLREVAAVSAKDASGFDRIVCYFVRLADTEVSAAALRAALAARLPAPLVPQLIAVPRLPVMPNGKVDRGELSAMAARCEPESRSVAAPRDPIELRLVRVWKRVLKVQPVGVTDSFFELGGHSLLAVSLIAEVEREFGHSFPLATLLSSNTLERQAEILRQKAPVRAQAPLVPIEPNGRNRPLFLVHPTGGNVLCYADLALHLGQEQPIYALQDPALYEEGRVCESVEDMAAFYLDAIREVQGVGPYLLGGWSSGGVVAYEMAQQLRMKGEDAGLLALIDSQAPIEAHEASDDRALMASVGRLLVYLSDADPASFSKLDRLVRDGREYDFELLMELATAANVIPPGADPSPARRLFEVFRRNVGIIARYRPQVYSRRITLLRAADPLPENIRQAAIRFTSTERTFGWHRLGPVRVHDVPGHHLSMMKAPHAQTLTLALKESIDATNRIYDTGNRVFCWMLGC